MTELLDTLASKIIQPENKAKLANFLGVVKDITSSTAKVTVLETGNRFILSQKDGVVHVTVSNDFLDNMGNFELGVEGSTPFESNVHFNMSSVTPPSEKEAKKLGVEFVRTDDTYKANIGNGFLECLDDIRMVNMLKRPALPLPGFNIVKKYLNSQGFQVYVAGEEEEEDGEPGTVVVQAAPTTEPALGEKIVIKEVPIYVEKIVIREVPVEVQKIVIKEVPAYVEIEKNVEQEEESEKPASGRGPIQEEEEEEEDEDFEETEEDEEFEETEEDEEEEDPPARKLKGRWLNPQKTILKSGDYVYRVNKKIDGPTELLAVGRWDKDKQKRVPLGKGDSKIIKKLGNKIAKV